MSEKPILFSGPMVRAILDGRKTQTRRVLKPQPPAGVSRLIGPEVYCPVAVDRHGDEYEGKPIFGVYDEDGEFGTAIRFQPGDRLWVREAHAMIGPAICYRAEHEEASSGGPRVDVAWRPSIHMPRWASRITLEVTGVKVERLQDISEADARAEGCSGCLGPNPDFPDEWDPSPQEEFRDLWNSINGPGSWDADPWVVAIAFRVLSREQASASRSGEGPPSACAGGPSASQ
jgi:hypothetical protein